MPSFEKAKPGRMTLPASGAFSQIDLMACQLCGKPYPCVHHTVRSAVLVDQDHFDDSEDRFSGSLDAPATEMNRNSNPEGQRWREEVVSRVQQHRAKRRKHAPSDASLELNFQPANSSSDAFHNEPAPQPEPAFYRAELPKVIEFPS